MCLVIAFNAYDDFIQFLLSEENNDGVLVVCMLRCDS